MGEVVTLDQPISLTEAERQRFEKWVSIAFRTDEASSVLARSRGGDYVLRTARAAWSAWQAAKHDLVAQYLESNPKE